MGCDIHSMLEVCENGRWVCASEVREDEDGDLDVVSEPINDRNYQLFSMLANVRNGYGCAGADSGDELVPIAMPRGLPPDPSAEFARFAEEWGPDGHSHSYLTLSEILDYDFTRIATLRGVLSAHSFSAWDIGPRVWGAPPKGYSLGVLGRHVKYVDEATMRRLVKAEFEQAGSPEALESRLKDREAGLGNYYCQCEWTQPYHDLAGELLTRTVPLMLKEARTRGISDDLVRVCFFFDN